VAEILAAREHGIVLLNPETVHAHKNPLLAAAEVAGCASHPTSVWPPSPKWVWGSCWHPIPMTMIRSAL